MWARDQYRMVVIERDGGCDNNLPNTGRNPSLADDNEFIIVRVPGLLSLS